MRILLVSLAAIGLDAARTAPAALATISEKTKEMTAMPGYFPMYYDAQERIAVEESFRAIRDPGLHVEAPDDKRSAI